MYRFLYPFSYPVVNLERLVWLALRRQPVHVPGKRSSEPDGDSTASTARLFTIRSVNSSGVNLAWVVGVAMLRCLGLTLRDEIERLTWAASS